MKSIEKIRGMKEHKENNWKKRSRKFKTMVACFCIFMVLLLLYLWGNAIKGLILK